MFTDITIYIFTHYDSSLLKSNINFYSYIKFNSYIELSNLEAILNYVKLNIGVSCVPYMSVLSEENSKSINVYRIKDHKINRSLYSAIHKDKYISKPIECFMKFCEKTDI